MIASVFIDSLSASTDKIYDYHIPESICGEAKEGKRIIAPFGNGNKPTQALIIELSDESNYDKSKLKDIIEIIDIEPIVPSYLITLAKFIRENFFCTYAQAMFLILPPKGRVEKKEYLTIGNNKQECELKEVEKILLSLVKKRNGKATIDYLNNKINRSKEDILKTVFGLVDRGLLVVKNEYLTKHSKNEIRYYSLSKKYKSLEDIYNNIDKRAVKQRKCIELLFSGPKPIDELRRHNIDLIIANKLIDKGIVVVEDKEEVELSKSSFTEKITLTENQKKVFDEYIQVCDVKKKFLLFGVTGSGKTQIYLNMIEEEMKKGKQSLFLVPEIALTPQMMDSIYSRFGEKAAVIHSKLSLSERDKAWERIRKGQVKIVLGARSAIFMPFKNLGLIVVDEEHEGSYQSTSSPRYNTIRIANEISDLVEAKLVLGSATPSIESFYKANVGEYHLLKLLERANKKPFPPVHIVDMREELYNGNRSMLSRKLQQEIKLRIDKKEQVILFLNRRGYSTYVFCRSCGYIEKCPNCDVSLTYHIGKSHLVCHYCGYKKEIPSVCPECKSTKIKQMGTGTQKVEEKVKEMFPSARVLRLDSDVTSKSGAFQNVLDIFKRKEADILIGTQMVVKGLDFSNVTLVGILLADATLTFPDINAAQRTFQLCTQAAGRAGRGDREGCVVMQTYKSENKTLVYASDHDYEGFYGFEIEHREKMNYPPFSEIIGIFCANEDEKICNDEIYKVYDIIRDKINKNAYENIKLYKPSPAFIHKLKGKYMMHILIKYPLESNIKKDIRKDYNKIKSKIKSNMFVEINPITLL